MAMEEDYGYEIDNTIKVVKGKTSRPLAVKMLKKKHNTGKPSKVKLNNRVSGLGHKVNPGDSYQN